MNSHLNPDRRWYDRDPVLSNALNILETSEDSLQIQIALNLIKVIAEHNMEIEAYTSVEEMLASVEHGRECGNSRWYDIDETVRTAIQLLKTCSLEMQKKLAHDIVEFITSKLDEFEDDEEVDI